MYKLWISKFDESQFSPEDALDIKTYQLSPWLRNSFGDAVREITGDFRALSAYRYFVKYTGDLEISYIEYVPKPQQVLAPEMYDLMTKRKDYGPV